MSDAHTGKGTKRVNIRIDADLVEYFRKGAEETKGSEHPAIRAHRNALKWSSAYSCASSRVWKLQICASSVKLLSVPSQGNLF